MTPGERTEIEPAGSRKYSEAFTAFYQAEYPQMVRLATLLSGSADVGEDVTQDAFVAVSKRFDRLDEPSAYLRSSVLNLVRRGHRDRQRHAARLRLLRRADTTAGGYETIELADLIAALPFRQRVVVVGRATTTTHSKSRSATPSAPERPASRSPTPALPIQTGGPAVCAVAAPPCWCSSSPRPPR